jgi:pimeloyl-ACP methyl ester carboxylesterase
MSTIHHTARGDGAPPIVLVHGFACAQGDWDAQVAHLSTQHRTVAVDLPAHGATPGEARDCTIERFGADVAQVVRELRLRPAVLVGHSMGCRVAIEAALQAPTHTAAVVLVDGSQFAPAMEPVLQERLATPAGFAAASRALFEDMFTPASDRATASAVIERAGRLPPETGARLLLDLVRYDVHRLAHSLAALHVPLMVLQTTYSNERRERKSLSKGQTSPYLEMVRANVPTARIEIIPGVGHFPQLDAPGETNALLASFAASIRA